MGKGIFLAQEKCPALHCLSKSIHLRAKICTGSSVQGISQPKPVKSCKHTIFGENEHVAFISRKLFFSSWTIVDTVFRQSKYNVRIESDLQTCVPHNETGEMQGFAHLPGSQWHSWTEDSPAVTLASQASPLLLSTQVCGCPCVLAWLSEFMIKGLTQWPGFRECSSGHWHFLRFMDLQARGILQVSHWLASKREHCKATRDLGDEVTVHTNSSGVKNACNPHLWDQICRASLFCHGMLLECLSLYFIITAKKKMQLSAVGFLSAPD